MVWFFQALPLVGDRTFRADRTEAVHPRPRLWSALPKPEAAIILQRSNQAAKLSPSVGGVDFLLLTWQVVSSTSLIGGFSPG